MKLTDRRTKGYVLTDKGREAIEKGVPLWRKAQQHMISQFGEDRYTRLLEELTMIRSLAITPKSTRLKDPTDKC
jgi:DNA-binding MarR family transcriptional regulator